MTLKTEDPTGDEPPRPSLAMKVFGLTLLSILFAGVAAVGVTKAHSALLTVFSIVGGLALVGGAWMTFQTRLTLNGVSGFRMSGLKLPRRSSLPWAQVTSAELSNFSVTLHGDGGSIQVNLAIYSDASAVLAFLKARLSHLNLA